MNPEKPHGSWLRNWLSLSGAIVGAGSLFSFIVLFAVDEFAHVSNLYIGVSTFLVAPGFLITGLVPRTVNL